MRNGNQLPLVDLRRRTRAISLDQQRTGGGRDNTRRASRNYLVLQYIFRFAIELVREFVDATDLVIRGWLRGFAKQAPNRFCNKCRSIRRNMVDLLRQVVGKVHLNTHRSNSTRGSGVAQRTDFTPRTAAGGGRCVCTSTHPIPYRSACRRTHASVCLSVLRRARRTS